MSEKPADDLGRCEHCGSEVPWERIVRQADCDFCDACYARWFSEFRACEHEWSAAHDDHGEPGFYCRGCAAIVCQDDWKSLFPGAALPLVATNGG